MDSMYRKLCSTDPAIVAEGLGEIDAALPTLEDDQIPLVVDALTSLFYIDTFDVPDLASIVEEAQQIVAKLGPQVIPHLLEKVRNSDIKAELALARTCGLMGEKAIDPLLDVIREKENITDMSFALYAFGKIKSPKIVKTIPHLIAAVKSPARETEDTAVRALGKVLESTPRDGLSAEQIQEIVDIFMAKSHHSNEVIRSKAIRGLGKMLQFGFLDEPEKVAVMNRLREIVGLDDPERWDSSYLVRREAQQILDNR
ncbi:MAG: HEAT repeat domain-containing protein [Fidelibacterota bacterium]